MRSQGDGELVQHRKTDQNKENVEEDEDEEYGVRRSVKKLDPREPSKEEGIRRWRRCTWTSCSWEMKAMTGRWRCWW